jgi:hypothetical protein
MIDFDWIVKHLKIRVTREQREAAHFLESRGGSFCGNFGVYNCIEIAGEVIMAMGDPVAEREVYMRRGLRVLELKA